MTMDNEFHRRLQALEEWKQLMLIDKAREDESKKHIDGRFDRLEDSLKTLQGIWNKVIWLVASAIAVSFVTFIIKGGLNV